MEVYIDTMKTVFDVDYPDYMLNGMVSMNVMEDSPFEVGIDASTRPTSKTESILLP